MVNTLKIEDRLEGATIFWAWKFGVLLLLEENDLKEYVDDVVPSPTNLQELATHKNREVKAKQILLDSMKDHLIPHISEKTPKDMYDALVGFYQSGNVGRKLILKHQFQAVDMASSNIVVSLLPSLYTLANVS
jgi:hypothetical protein